MNTARKILGLPETATFSQVKIAYRKLVRRFHPDQADGDLHHFQEVTLAYQVLERFYEHFPIPLSPAGVRYFLKKPVKRPNFIDSIFNRL